ncbi:MAG: T9SS type A sorting domain-containing protein [Bacteroidales bacterium]|nr:T9SS type A sorting domain-containing protein [Bacteroidales bacterium]
MKMKYYLIFLALLLSFGFNNKAFSQKCLTFKYDANGNRISRTINKFCQVGREVAEEQDEEPSDDAVKVYPNPTNGSFKVVLPENIRSDNAYYELFDVNGWLISNGNIYGDETDVDIGKYAAGVYLLRIKNGDDVISEIVLKQ